MNRKQLATIAVGSVIAANAALADWTDYFWIGCPVGGFIPAMGPGSVPLPVNPNGAVNPVDLTPWVFSVGSGMGEFTRSPGAPNVQATGFTITGDVPGTLASLTILNPFEASQGGPMNGSSWSPMYHFSWNFDAKPGSTAYWIDADGMHPMNPVIGQGFFKVDMAADPGLRDTYGFYLNAADLNTLQIQGWEAVPEPSSIAMGVVTLLGGALAGYRRWRKA